MCPLLSRPEAFNRFYELLILKKIFIITYLFVQGATGWTQTLDSTKLVTVNKILIEGNKKTKPQFITRELSFKQGEKHQIFQLDSMFEWDKNRIYNTNLFNEVTFSVIELKNSNVDIVITVDERWYLYPIPIFKLVDRNFNDWWSNRNRDLSRVNYGLNLTKYNFRGRGERLRVSHQFGFTRRFSFSYQLPYIEKTQRHGLGLDFNYLEAKNLAFNTENNLRRFLESESLLRKVYRNNIIHSYRSSFYSFHFTTLGHTSVSITDTIATLHANYLGDGVTHQKYLTARYSYSWDKRNNKNYPTKGERYSLGIRKFGLGIYDDVDFWVIDFKLSKYLELGNEFYYAGNVIGLISFPEDRDFFNYFAIGFQRNVLRGYDLNIIEGSTFFIQKNEVKKKFFSHTQDISRFMPIRQFQTFPVILFGKVFFDQGYAKSYPNHIGSDRLTDQYLYSYGLGIDLMMIYDTVFRFELSQNTLGETNFFINFGAAL